MGMPGFTAEVSFYESSAQYRVSALQKSLGHDTSVFPQFDLNGCIDICYIVDVQCVDACYLLDAISFVHGY
jgi:hypothetical protein